MRNMITPNRTFRVSLAKMPGCALGFHQHAAKKPRWNNPHAKPVRIWQGEGPSVIGKMHKTENRALFDTCLSPSLDSASFVKIRFKFDAGTGILAQLHFSGVERIESSRAKKGS
jgi:hypothetical protein